MRKLRPVEIEQGFSDVSVHQKSPRDLVKTDFCTPSPEFLIQEGWGGI